MSFFSHQWIPIEGWSRRRKNFNKRTLEGPSSVIFQSGIVKIPSDHLSQDQHAFKCARVKAGLSAWFIRLSWSAYFFKPESVPVSAASMIGKALVFRIIIGHEGDARAIMRL